MSIAVIGGSGLYNFEGLEIVNEHSVDTIYGSPSDIIIEGKLEGQPLFFLPRHGKSHGIPPHRVNYQANIIALKQLGVSRVIAVNAVGGISEQLAAGDIVIPDQLIDYTFGREHTFSDGSGDHVEHIDFTEPFSESLRQLLCQAAEGLPWCFVKSGVYGCTQGPRLETAAEIRRMAQDGCDIVGMTAMPEAALAKEIGLEYASISIVANLAAGLSEDPITLEEIQSVVSDGVERIQKLIQAAVIQ